MDRSEDLKQVRDLHLVRDERDREVEAAAGLRAGNAVVLVSQLLSAVCLLQDDPAWMALLSLTLVWGGVKGFWRFRQDQERIYLVWGLLTCAGAAALLLAYLMPSLRRMFTTGSAVALALFTALAAVLSVVAGLRSRSFTLGCLTFAGCCAALTVLFLLRSSWLTEGFSAVLSALCLFAPFEEFVNSNFSIPTLVYYLTVAVLFLFFTVQELEKRRWN